MAPFVAANACAHSPAAAGLAPMQTLFSKVPQITLSFWAIKILCTTVGETGADFLVVDAGLGLRVTLVAMATLLVLALAVQLHTQRCTPWIYWLTVVLVSIMGTQITDLLTDGLGVPLAVSTPAMAGVLTAIFALWYRVEKPCPSMPSSRAGASCFTGPPLWAPLPWARPQATWPAKPWALAMPVQPWGLAR